MDHPIVSVVMPVYNVEQFVGEAIRSVLDQSFRDFELIIVDDGGSDGSMAICRGFSDPRIRIVSQPNRGLAGARNTGIAAANGRHVALLDADDRWHRTKLMLHVIHLEASPEVGISYSGSRLIDGQGRVLKVAMRPKLRGISAVDILTRNPVGNGSAPVIRRSVLDRALFGHPDDPQRPCWFDESFRQSEDIELWLRLALRYDCRFEGIEGALTDYRIVGGGLSAQIARQYDSWQRAIEVCCAQSPDFIARHRGEATAFQLRYLARRAVQLGDGPFAVSLIRQALSASPRILLLEPAKTIVTVGGAIAARMLPAPVLRRLGQRYFGVEDMA